MSSMLRGLLMTLVVITVGPFVIFFLGSVLYFEALGLYALYQKSQPGYVEPWNKPAQVAIGNVVFSNQKIFTTKQLVSDQPSQFGHLPQATRLELNIFAQADGSLTHTPPVDAKDNTKSRILVVVVDANYSPFGKDIESSPSCTEGPKGVCQQTFILEKDRLVIRIAYEESLLSESESYEAAIRGLIAALTSNVADYGLPR